MIITLNKAAVSSGVRGLANVVCLRCKGDSNMTVWNQALLCKTIMIVIAAESFKMVLA